VRELFRAVNDFGGRGYADDSPEERDRRYRACGFTHDVGELERRTSDVQQAVNAGELSYNEAIGRLGRRDEWTLAASWQTATIQELEREHLYNEDAAHRVVGLTIETRPDLITRESAREMRELGCTKIQMGIQSLDRHILEINHRHVSIEQIEEAFSALRLAGFKIQVHFMANLLGSTPDADAADYLRLVTDERFLPDEVKLYPCCLVESSRLGAFYESGTWQPYGEGELVDLLVADTPATPAYTRISRMIRDISSTDIVAGNKKTNLRQMVEARITGAGAKVREIRMREVATSDVAPSDLRLDCVSYHTTVSDERFLQWVTPDGRIAGFLRLSLPLTGTEAMIREVHVYGRVAGLGASERGGAQHVGLGRSLVEEACRRAHEAEFVAINVISAIGTRNYYRRLGFQDNGLYQQMKLSS
jgi:elongator complex protein 3